MPCFDRSVCPCVLLCSLDHGDLHSLPPRRSSDLSTCPAASPCCRKCRRTSARRRSSAFRCSPARPRKAASTRCCAMPGRSKEHTSELQSLRHLVCRLLLEKNTPKWSRPTLSERQC